LEGEKRRNLSFLEGELYAMADERKSEVRARLREKLEESLAAPLPAATPRQVYGRIMLPGKATSVIGMRRAG
jgi:hypothetical protein